MHKNVIRMLLILGEVTMNWKETVNVNMNGFMNENVDRNLFLIETQLFFKVVVECSTL